MLTLTILISPCIPEFLKPIGMAGELEFLVWLFKRQGREETAEGYYIGKQERFLV